MAWKNLRTRGQAGSEGGKILADEQYKNKCRVTLEKTGRHYAITSSIYGAMTHTAFCGDNFQDVYANIKSDLEALVDSNPDETELLKFCRHFDEKY